MVARFMWAKHNITFQSFMRREALPTRHCSSSEKIEAFSIASESEAEAEVGHHALLLTAHLLPNCILLMCWYQVRPVHLASPCHTRMAASLHCHCQH